MKPVRLAFAALLLCAAPVFAGPPWISIEYPANPFDPETRDALMLIHTFHHRMPTQFPLQAYAEGNVNGARKRIPLQIVATSHTGVWAVRGELPTTGMWIIRADMNDPETHAVGSALISINNNELVGVKVPFRNQNGWKVPVVATQADVDRLLAQR